MFDIGFTELLVIGVVALIVVGPKDLPGMFRTLGRFTARARQMGREFSQAMNEAADESGVKDISDNIKSATSSKAMGLDALNKAADGFEKWDPAKALRDQKAADEATKPKPEELSALESASDEAARKIHAATTKAAEAPKADQTAKAAAKPKAAATKKPAAKPAAAKKTPAKKPAAKTPPKTASAKKPAAKSAAKAKPKSKTKPTDTSSA
ncbi:Sec-independent protein translocase protein TatB [Aliiroseovarius sp. 2305UL8-7]|uniref:Sec-independent protein translocase protein TatB n=1 Tax=Aliiroseovarius conchicola TaxID=3121637 RepID=UPI003526CE04